MNQIIKNFENYSINENGEIVNNTTNKKLSGSIGENGYKYFRLRDSNSKPKTVYCHILVAQTFIKNPNNYKVVNHIDGNKLNNNINNLEWVSYSKNVKEWHRLNNNKTKGKKHIKYCQDLQDETWKVIKDYSNYMVSSFGRVRNIKNNNLLRPCIINGYYKVSLCQNGIIKDFVIHKLVYSTFNDDYNISNFEVIDHIDGNKLNNNINNLRKITISENVKSAYYSTKTNSNIRRVGQYALDGVTLINEFDSIREASRYLNLDCSVISKVCRGVKYKTHGGFIFKYL